MIDFSPTPEQDALCEVVRSLMAKHAPEPYLSALDLAEEYPYDLYRAWADAGLLGLPFAVEHGGQGGSVLDLVLVAEELGRSGYDLVGVYGTPLFCGLNLAHNGTPEQHARWLPPLIAGELRLSVAITEPDAGSDAGAMRTRATPTTNGSHRLTGEKVFASGAGVDGTTICTYARTGDGPRDITCFLVPNDSPGLTVERIATLGRHLFPTTRLHLDGVEVPPERVLGPVNGGWDVLLSGLRLERLVTSAAYVGNAAAVVAQALEHSKARTQFGRRIGDFQAMAHLLADMHTSVEAARYLMWRAAWAHEKGEDALLDIAMAKLFGSEVFATVANQGMQVLGGYGYSMDLPMQRHFRAARGATITAGTSQMQRNLIAGKLGLRPIQ